MKGLKKITSIVLAIAMVVTLITVAPVTNVDAKVKINYGKKLTLVVGKSDRIYVAGKGATFTSSDKKIATVNKKGNVKAKKVGACKITIKQNGSKATAKITVVPANVKMQSVTLASDTSAKVTWGKAKGAQGYYVYRSTSAKSGFKKVATVKGAKTTSYVSTGLAAGTTYYYRVKAYAKSGKKTYTSKEYPKALSVKTWKLIWNDEFNGTTLDTTKWNNKGATGDGGYGNQELQNYQMEYSKVENGNFVIMPQMQWNTASNSYVRNSAKSTKIWTNGQHEFTYGKIEFRVKLPKAQGTWAAAWMLGNNNNYGPWPMCGEIDILETMSESTKTLIPQTIHCNRFNGMSTSSGPKNRTTKVSTATSEYHTYGIIWNKDSITFTIDGKETWTYNPNNYKATGKGGNLDPDIWPYNKPFYLILNCAIGGTLGGNITPDGWTEIARNGNIVTYQDYYYIDWVRVYQ